MGDHKIMLELKIILYTCALCTIWYALYVNTICYMLCAICYMLHATCYMLHAICYMLHAIIYAKTLCVHAEHLKALDLQCRHLILHQLPQTLPPHFHLTNLGHHGFNGVLPLECLLKRGAL
jgi:hypothetical protein